MGAEGRAGREAELLEEADGLKIQLLHQSSPHREQLSSCKPRFLCLKVPFCPTASQGTRPEAAPSLARCTSP